MLVFASGLIILFVINVVLSDIDVDDDDQGGGGMMIPATLPTT
jgi:hypothetical protein